MENTSISEQIQELINQWESAKASSEKDILEWETKTLKTIFPHRFENIDIIVKDMVGILNKNDKFWCPGSNDPNYMSYFNKQEFNSFMDYFTRELSANKNSEILSNLHNCSMIVPN